MRGCADLGYPVPASRTVGRPVSDRPKIATTMRVDADVLATFKASGKGWQTRINQVLRYYVRTQMR